MSVSTPRTARRIRVTGVVQGVGFRPFVHRLADRHQLGGWVRNASGDVEIVVHGDDDAIDAFLAQLVSEAPPLARIAAVRTEDADEIDDAEEFRILQSLRVAGDRQPVPADVVLCEACERELFDPSNRRYHYPFITCTDCGPRYTVIESLPYDRERTTMRAFAQCEDCRREYETPGDRRYHSETNSCPTCGPRLWAGHPEARSAERISSRCPDEILRFAQDDVVEDAAAALRRGAIVAIRGVGGFHLAVDATNDAAVQRLRQRKHRDAKPFAVMVRTLEDARALAHLNDEDEALLTDPARPVVLLRRRLDARIADSVAPSLDTIGVLLAYTPVQHLLLERARVPLVMTSGNRSEEPIAASIEDASSRLAGIADVFLLHDREIVSPVDDSVVRACGDRALIIRRARGYAPIPVRLPLVARKPILAVGGHLKSTFTVAVGSEAYVSPHLGDLDGLETLNHYRATLDRYTKLFDVTPEVVARDLHGGYLSTRIAAESGIADEVVVQHHHAHIAAVLGEHKHDAPALGIAFDGTGMGADGTVWGAEFLVATQASYARAGHLRYVPLPGGETAIRSPWRTLLGYASLEPSVSHVFARTLEQIPEHERRVAQYQLTHNVNAPLASSMGRLFDAASAVLGLCAVARFEGDAAMRLEAAADSTRGHVLPFPIIRDDHGLLQLDPLPLLAALAEGVGKGESISELAASFHESVAHSTSEFAEELCIASNITTVALGGGVFQNARLTQSLVARLRERRLTVLLPIELPANDGGLSYGQAVVAAAVLHERAD